MENLRGLLAIRRMERVPNAWIRVLCRVKKGLDERIDESVLRWFGNVERMERDRIAKRVYVRERAGSCSVGRSQKRCVYAMKDCLRQARKMVQDRCEWRGFVRGNDWGVARG